MTTTIIINNGHQMNGSISITLPIPTIILQFPIGHQQNNGVNVSCMHCGQCNLLQTNDMKEEKIEIKEEVIEIKGEAIDIKEEVIEIKGEAIDIKEEVIEIKGEAIDIKEEVIEIKGEAIDIKEEVIEIKEEDFDFDFDFEMDQYILNEDANLYLSICSPISKAESEDVDSNESFVFDDEDENFDVTFQQCLNDISAIMQYLKEDIILN